MWLLLSENDIPILEDLKPILSATKFDSLALLSNLDDTDTEEIRNFMRTEYHQLLEAEEIQRIYGVYSRKPENFEFTGGLKKSLKAVVHGCGLLMARLKRKRLTTPEKVYFLFLIVVLIKYCYIF